MKVLAFSDVHCDADAARRLVTLSESVDLVLGAGDFAVMRRGLQPLIDVLSAISTPTVVVPGNGESADELAAACEGWEACTVLHGATARVEGWDVFGLGGGIPVTPFGAWSFDLSEEEAERRVRDCPRGAVVVSHSPPYGHVDTASVGEHLGSRALLRLIETAEPTLFVCGHIHGCWGQSSSLGVTRIVNCGPEGVVLELGDSDGPTVSRPGEA